MIWKEHEKKLCKYQYHIDNRAKWMNEFNEFLSALIKSLKINYFIAWEDSWNAITENEEPQRTE